MRLFNSFLGALPLIHSTNQNTDASPIKSSFKTGSVKKSVVFEQDEEKEDENHNEPSQIPHRVSLGERIKNVIGYDDMTPQERYQMFCALSIIILAIWITISGSSGHSR